MSIGRNHSARNLQSDPREEGGARRRRLQKWASPDRPSPRGHLVRRSPISSTSDAADETSRRQATGWVELVLHRSHQVDRRHRAPCI